MTWIELALLIYCGAVLGFLAIWRAILGGPPPDPPPPQKRPKWRGPHRDPRN